MFTGIIEAEGTVNQVTLDDTNRTFRIESNISSEFKIDQSISHDGVCLTVTLTGPSWHEVTAVKETIDSSCVGNWVDGSKINLERCLKIGDRLDGHLVQGHVDSIGTCMEIKEVGGSWYFHFSYDPAFSNMLVDKGSITVNGISLTVINPGKDRFSIAIIPYTFEHTNFRDLKVNDTVNLEFDIIGKYIQRKLDPPV